MAVLQILQSLHWIYHLTFTDWVYILHKGIRCSQASVHWHICFKISPLFRTVLLIVYGSKIRIHLRQSISSVLKWFSQTYSSPVSIWRRKLLSTTRSFVIMFSQASRVLVDNSSLPDGILKIPSPTCFLLVPQPNIEQLAPGIVENIAKPTAFFVLQHMVILHSLYRITIWPLFSIHIMHYMFHVTKNPTYFVTWPGLPNPVSIY